MRRVERFVVLQGDREIYIYDREGRYRAKKESQKVEKEREAQNIVSSILNDIIDVVPYEDDSKCILLYNFRKEGIL